VEVVEAGDEGAFILNSEDRKDKTKEKEKVLEHLADAEKVIIFCEAKSLLRILQESGPEENGLNQKCTVIPCLAEMKNSVILLTSPEQPYTIYLAMHSNCKRIKEKIIIIIEHVYLTCFIIH
jgi:hypothetical protein